MNQLLRNARHALARFPYTYLFGLIAGVTYFLQHLLPYNSKSDQLEHFLCAAIFAIPLSIGVIIATEHRPIKPIAKSVLQTLLVFVPTLLVLIYLRSGDGNSYATTYGSCLVLAHLVLTYAVSFQLHWSSTSYWNFNYLLFLRFSYATIVATIWFLGNLVILYAIQLLFHFDYRFFDDAMNAAFAFSTFILHPLVFCSSFPTDFNRLPELPHPRPLLLVAQYVMLPLVFIYTVVLYLYLGKCIVTGAFPQGLIASMTVGASVAGLASLLAILPLEGNERYPWVKRVNYAFYLWVIPLLAASIWSLSVRIGEYGQTLSRYGLLLYCLWMLVMAVLGVMKRVSFALMHISLFAVVAIATIGPLSLGNVTLRSQKAELVSLLKPLELIQGDGSIQFESGKEIAPQIYNRINNILSYISRHHPWRELAPLLPEKKIAELEENSLQSQTGLWERSGYVMNYLKLKSLPTEGAAGVAQYYWQAVADRWLENGILSIEKTIEINRWYVLKEVRLRLGVKGHSVIVQDLEGKVHTTFDLGHLIKGPRRNERVILFSHDRRQSVVLKEYQASTTEILSMVGLWRLRAY